MTHFIANIIYRATDGLHRVLKPFVSERFLARWKPIHLCWWFRKHNLPIPQYFIGTHVTAPSVSTSAATNIATTSVTGNGNITATNDANPSERGFAYMAGTSGDPTTSNSTVSETGSFGTGAFALNITGLTQGTAYRVRAYAINSAGTGYGATVDVTTASAATSPTVTTEAATDVAFTTATGNGTVVSDGGSAITERGVCWSTTTNPTTASSKATSAGTTGAFTVAITGLAQGTLYYARAYAINSLGTSYGSEVTFTTSEISNKGLAQYAANHSTKIATGASTTDGESTKLYFDALIASSTRGDTINFKAEIRALGTAFTNAATHTGNNIIYDSDEPGVRRSHAMAYDSLRKRVILFGGFDDITNFSDVWALNLDPIRSPQPQWKQLTPSGTTGGRRTHIMEYDAVNDRMIISHGYDGADDDQTWELDFSTNENGVWTQLTPSGTPPVARTQSASVYDPANNCIYLVHGWSASRHNDIWKLSLTNGSEAWTQLIADDATPSPPARNDPAVILDATNNRIIIFGGRGDSAYLNDTWEFDLTTNTYTDLTSTVGTAPTVRENCATIRDAGSNQMIIWGGRSTNVDSATLSDLWGLSLGNGTEAWTQHQSQDGSTPAGTWGGRGVYDPEHKAMVVYGGQDQTGVPTQHTLAIDLRDSADIQALDLNMNTWLRDRDAQGYAYNPDRNEAVIMGGFARTEVGDTNLTRAEHSSETWIYNFSDKSWSNPIRDSFFTIPNREGNTVVYDTTNNRFIIFGGLTGTDVTNPFYYNDTWELKADANGDYHYKKLEPTGTKPSRRWLHGAVYDSVNNRMVVFGGHDADSFKNDVWSLSLVNGSEAWTQLTPTGTAPTARRQMTYIYDSTNNRMIISHGGTSVTAFANNTLALSLTSGSEAWTTISTSGSTPSGRRGMTGIFDATNGTMIAFGGYDGTNVHSTTYILNLSTGAWTLLSPATVPEARRSHSASFDPTNRKMMIYGGRDAPDDGESFHTRNNTWELDMSNASSANWTWTKLTPTIYILGSVSATGLTGSTSYHWQGWASGAGADSTKLSYGGNLESEADFAIVPAAPTVALNTPADAATGISLTPTLEFTGTDAQGDDVRYNVQVDTVNTFNSSSTIDSYSESNQNNTYAVQSDFRPRNGQSFTGDGSVLGSVVFQLVKTGSPTGNVVVEIYAHTGTFGTNGTPTGSPLATSGTLDVSTLTTSLALKEFFFTGSNQITLTNGTKYFAVLNSDSSGAGGNYISLGFDSTSPTHAGNQAYYSGGTWTSISLSDLCFYVKSKSNLQDKVSGTHAGFANTVTPADTDPFNSGEKADYDIQAGDTLSASTVYYWRVRGLDPAGSNTYGAWATTRSFTTGTGGTHYSLTCNHGTFTHTGQAATLTYTQNTPPTVALNSPADLATGLTATPTLEFTGTDAQGNDVRYNIHIGSDNAFTESGISDPDSVWTNDANAFDGNLGTAASSSGGASTTINYLSGTGTNSPTTGTSITQVRVRIAATATNIPPFTETIGLSGAFYVDGEALGTAQGHISSSSSYGSYVTLTAPTGGWTHEKVKRIEVRFYNNQGGNHEARRAEVEVTSGTVDTYYVDGSYASLILNKISGTDSGFANTVTPADTDPFNSGEKVDYDVGQNLFYVDGSDAVFSDPNSVWTNEANIVDNNTTTHSYATADGTSSSNYLKLQGSNYSGTSPITSVRVRGHGKTDFLGTTYPVSSWFTLSPPSGGWTAVAIQALEFRIWRTTTGEDTHNYIANVYTDNEAETLASSLQLYSAMLQGGTASGLTKIELEVTVSLTASTTYYWRVRGIDPTGSNTYGAWSSTRSFTTDAGVTHYSLTCNHGSFTHTGQAAGLARGFTLTANHGTYTHTGQSATLTRLRTFTLTANHGVYALTGQSAILNKAALINAPPGTFTLTGQSATFTYTRALSLGADHGSFILNGQAIVLDYNRAYTLTGLRGTFTLTGQDANFTYTRAYSLTCNHGTFVLTGQSATLTYLRFFTLTANHGSFTLTGQAANLSRLRSLSLTANHGTFALSGQAAGITRTALLAANHGAFILNGQAAVLDYNRVITLTGLRGTFTLTGQAAGLTATRTLSANYGAFTLAGQAAGITSARTLAANHGTFALTGQAAGLTATRFASLAHGTFILNGQAIVLDYNRVITLTGLRGTFTLTGQNATFVATRTITSAHGSYTLTGQSAGLARGLTLIASHGVYNLTGQSAGLITTRTASLSHGVFTLNGQAISLNYSRVLTLTALRGVFTLTGQAVLLSSTRTIGATHGAFTLTGQAAGVTSGRLLSASHGTYTHTGQAATLHATRTASLSHGTYALSGQAVALDYTQALTLTGLRGTFTLTGQNSVLTATRTLTATYGTYSHTGQNAELMIGTYLGANYGTYVLTGQSAGALATRTLAGSYGAFTLTGQAAVLDYNRVFTLTGLRGTYTLSGQDTGLYFGRTVAANHGTFTLTGQEVILTVESATTIESSPMMMHMAVVGGFM